MNGHKIKPSKRSDHPSLGRRKAPKTKKNKRPGGPVGKRIRTMSAAVIQPVSFDALPADIAPDDQLLDVNVPGLGKNSTNPNHRLKALLHAVNNVWRVADISVIRRVESGPSHKWVLWRRSSVPPA